jgi:hypothetical protein
MMCPALGNSYPAALLRELCLDEAGRALFEEDGPDVWERLQEMEPTLCHIAELRVSLLSESLDAAHVRAAFEIERFTVDTPIGPTHPRMGDYLAIDVGGGLCLRYHVELTAGEVAEGAEADIGPGELLLSRAGAAFDARQP